ncbi:MAG: hypothetical protein GF353_18180 [Candidatus Lokiarchaeota archaeon]|nr:hypothetical protein [Candidatus Lokiarchaeota archaeon]
MKLPWYKKATVQSAIVTGIFVIFGTIIGSLIVKDWKCDPDKKIIPMDENAVSVLILPFDPLEDCTAKEEDIAKSVYWSLKNQIVDESLANFEARYEPEGFCPASHTESREIAKKYHADIVVWGTHLERCYPDTSRICVNYTIADTTFNFKERVGSTGIQKATCEQIYQGKLLDDVNYIVIFLIAQYYYRNENYHRAIDYFKKAVSFKTVLNDSSLAELYFYLAVSNYYNSIDYNLKAPEIDLFQIPTCINRGVDYNNSEEYNRAIEDYTEAIEMDSLNVSAYINRGADLNLLGEYDQAIEDYTKAIMVDSLTVSAYVNRGGEYKRSTIEHNKATKLDNQNPIIFYNKSITYAQLNKKREFIESLQKAFEYGILDQISIEDIKNDTNFAFLKGDPEFKKLIDQYSKK